MLCKRPVKLCDWVGFIVFSPYEKHSTNVDLKSTNVDLESYVLFCIERFELLCVYCIRMAF